MTTISSIATADAGNLWAAAGTLWERQRRLDPIRPLPRGGLLQPSFAQERIWRLCRGAPGSAYFNVAVAWEIRGAVNAGALEEAVRTVVHRHEVLRTRFCEVGGVPFVRLENREPVFEEAVLEGGSGDSSRAAALASAQAEFKKPFDLDRDRLFKAVLFRSGPAQGLLLLKVHQMLFDGGSMLLLGRELGELYAERVGLGRASLASLSVQYYDFAAWQRRLMADGSLVQEQAFWSEQFRTRYVPMALGNRASANGYSLLGPTHRTALRISEPVCRQLTRLAGETGTTFFSALLAGMQSCLRLYARQNEVVVFATASGRQQRELRNLVGLVANVLPFRAHFGDHTSFRGAVKLAGQTVSSALTHQLLPLEKILERAELSGEGRAGGLCQAMLIFQNSGRTAFSAGETAFIPLKDLDNGAGRFAIQVEARRVADGLAGWVKCRTDLLEPGFGVQFVAALANLLEHWTRHPDEPLKLAPASPILSSPAVEVAPRERGARVSLPFDEVAGDALEESLRQIWERVLNIPGVGVEDDFFTLGGDSFLAERLAMEIEQLTGRKLPLAALLEAPTLRALSRRLRGESSRAAWKSLVLLKWGERSLPIYLVHPQGGNVLGYRDLARRMAPDQPVYGLQAAGLDGLEKPLTRIEDMAERYLREIRELQPQGPYALSGQSFGGMVAFEMAQRLVQQQEQVCLLALIDTDPPDGQTGLLPNERFLWKVGFQLRRLKFHGAPLARLPWPEKLQYARTRLAIWRRRLEKQSRKNRDELENEILSARRPSVARWNTRARKAYRYRPYPGQVTWFRAAEPRANRVRNPEAVWRKLALGGLEVCRVPGTHISLVKEPHVTILARQMQQRLDRAFRARTH